MNKPQGRHVDLFDALVISGILLVATGVAFIFWPAGPIIAGVALVILGWRGA